MQSAAPKAGRGQESPPIGNVSGREQGEKLQCSLQKKKVEHRFVRSALGFESRRGQEDVCRRVKWRRANTVILLRRPVLAANCLPYTRDHKSQPMGRANHSVGRAVLCNAINSTESCAEKSAQPAKPSKSPDVLLHKSCDGPVLHSWQPRMPAVYDRSNDLPICDTKEVIPSRRRIVPANFVS